MYWQFHRSVLAHWRQIATKINSAVPFWSFPLFTDEHFLLVNVCVCQLEASHFWRYWFSVSVTTMYVIIGWRTATPIQRQCLHEQHPVANERNQGSYPQWLQTMTALMNVPTNAFIDSPSSFHAGSFNFCLTVKEKEPGRVGGGSGFESR